MSSCYSFDPEVSKGLHFVHPFWKLNCKYLVYYVQKDSRTTFRLHDGAQKGSEVTSAM